MRAPAERNWLSSFFLIFC